MGLLSSKEKSTLSRNKSKENEGKYLGFLENSSSPFKKHNFNHLRRT